MIYSTYTPLELLQAKKALKLYLHNVGASESGNKQLEQIQAEINRR